MKREIIVTGAGKGLGYAITKKHLDMGDSVYALELNITAALTSLKEKYDTLTIKQCDLGSDDSVKDAMADLVSSQKKINIIYNVAGIHFLGDRVPLSETDFDKCITLYNINALGPLRVLSQVSHLLDSNSVIINVTSESGSITDCARTNEYGYSMSKAAINMGSKTFANQTKDIGVRVFCLHPGWMKTDMGGEGARLSSKSITAEESADALISIALDAGDIPEEIMYLDYKRTPLKW